jgi:membrane protein implicated in regulation of membrane protease activity
MGTGIEAYLSVRKKLSRSKREALVEFLATGGYSLAAGSMAACAALVFWTSLIPKWAVRLMFIGLIMFLSAGFVYKGRRRKPPKQQTDSKREAI